MNPARLLATSLAFVLLAASGDALALAPEVVPTGTTGVQKPATSGSTEIADQGKFATAEDITSDDAEEDKDVTDLTVSAGGILSTGNARSAAATGALNFRLRRDRHEFSSIFAGNYGAAGLDDQEGYETTVANVQGRMRYDVFFAERWSAFIMFTGRNDRFQGLDMRLNIDPGVAFHILTKKNHRLWVEAGYDFQYDIRRYDAIIERDDEGNPVLDMNGNTNQIADKTSTVHAARLFAGYSNHLSEQVSFDTGVEYLQSLLAGDTFRINWDNAVTAQLVQNLALSATFTLRYENSPLPDVKKLDTITAMNLVYRFF